MRVNLPDVAAKLGVPADQFCTGLLLTNIEATTKNYQMFCCDPAHGAFGSPIHARTLKLRSKWAKLADKMVDVSHRPERQGFR